MIVEKKKLLLGLSRESFFLITPRTLQPVKDKQAQVSH